MTDKQTIEEGLQDALDDINIEDVIYLDDPDDPDVIEIVVTGTLKKGAFKKTGGRRKLISKPLNMLLMILNLWNTRFSLC